VHSFHVFVVASAALTLAPAPGLARSADDPKIHPALGAMLGAGEAGEVGGSATAKAWVFFTDKGAASHDAGAYRAAIGELTRTYNPRAIERRRLRRTDPGLFDLRDVPVAGEYVGQVSATGAKPRVQSAWVNAVSVEATRAQVEAIAALPFVRALQPIRSGVKPGRVTGGDRRPQAAAGPGAGDAGFYGTAEEQLTQINLLALHQQGFTGQGVIVGILDTGFLRTHEAFNQAGHPLVVVAEWDFVKDDGNTAPEPEDDPSQHEHGTMILGTLGGYKPNTYVGGAYDASFVLCKTEDIESETPVEEDYYVAGLQFIESHGGDMATASLIYIDWYTQSQLNGATAVTTIGVNVATANGVYCCNAAGNMGHDTNPSTSHLGAPADAFKVITVGAVTSENSIVGFSSDGPSADGRVKPELLARGAQTWTISPNGSTGYTTASGTSLSTPLVAGGVACLIDARPAWTVDQMRTILFATGKDFVVTGVPDPLFIRGYGIMDAAGAAAADCNANGVLDSLDILAGTSRDCNANGQPDECECRADYNADGALTVADFGSFQTGFVQGQACADFNGDGTHTVADFGSFQTAFVVGCP
jgi:subtilisin family serine protease